MRRRAALQASQVLNALVDAIPVCTLEDAAFQIEVLPCCEVSSGAATHGDRTRGDGTCGSENVEAGVELRELRDDILHGAGDGED